ncbi:MAG: class I SAM-dependent methyltransferase [Candidatus Omnitrophica bacterium]|nr:class I SAM-dependent methyltransferase [Candidatus Omnitrophota bacterium]
MNIFDRYYKRYDAWYDKNRFAYLSELEALRKVVPRKGKGLEIGVGTARFAAPLGISSGIDPAKKMVKIARERGVDAKVGSGENLPLKNSAFDYVAIIISLAFLKNPQKVLKEAKRVLRKKGKIIVAIVEKGSFLGRFYKKKKGVFYREANFLSAGEVAKMLKGLGFGNFSYHQAIFSLPHKIKSVEEPRRGASPGGFVVIRASKEK